MYDSIWLDPLGSRQLGCPVCTDIVLSDPGLTPHCLPWESISLGRIWPLRHYHLSPGPTSTNTCAPDVTLTWYHFPPVVETHSSIWNESKCNLQAKVLGVWLSTGLSSQWMREPVLGMGIVVVDIGAPLHCTSVDAHIFFSNSYCLHRTYVQTMYGLYD